MQVIDEITKRTVNYGSCKRVIVKFSEEGEIIYGYTRQWKDKCIPVMTRGKDGRSEKSYILNTDENRRHLFFSNFSGMMMSNINLDKKTYLRERFIYGQGKFPYSFDRRYEAVESFDIFKNRQEILEMKKYVLADYMPYTFGLEFETSAGIIEESLCVRDGLIPLRDGSITGIEYSTVVMQGNEGLSLLEQQLGTLRSRTAFNKECSLHIHFGGFPLNTEKIFRVYYLCRIFQNEIMKLVPELTFNTSSYKSSGKDYCKLLPEFRDFNQLYQGLVGRNYLGSLTQPHPNDVDRNRKWQINTRYFWVNFINTICYTVNKTIEFRLLRPTYNKGKIFTWMYIMNAILRYAETDLPLYYDPEVHGIPDNGTIKAQKGGGGGFGKEVLMMNTRTNNIRSTSSGGPLYLGDVLQKVYPKDVFEILDYNIQKLTIIAINQKNSNDKVGANLMFEDELFNEKENTVF